MRSAKEWKQREKEGLEKSAAEPDTKPLSKE
jgi:hypothetical protein